MMDGDLDGAMAAFQQIEQKEPDSPLGYVLEADVSWWRIYYVSANLVDPGVFDVANMEATPYDSHFYDLDNVAIHHAEARIHLRQDLARSYLYEGYAYALRARFEGLHDRDLPTARAGKKMRSLLLRAVTLDPNLKDAYLGRAFTTTLSIRYPVSLSSKVFIGFPAGAVPKAFSNSNSVPKKVKWEGRSQVLSRQGLHALERKAVCKIPAPVRRVATGISPQPPLVDAGRKPALPPGKSPER